MPTPRSVLSLALVFAIATPGLSAQSIPGAVLAGREPHHHLAYEDSGIRVLRVHVGAHDSTFFHEHDPDYFWIALGTSSFVNARPGAPDAVVAAPALSVHYAPGHFAHVARNPGDAGFDNITIELLGKQTHVRNLCEPAMAGQPLACRAPSQRFEDRIEHPAFETDQLHVSLFTLPAGTSMRRLTPAGRTWIVALDTADARALKSGAPWVGGVSAVRQVDWIVFNKGKRTVRLLVIAARG